MKESEQEIDQRILAALQSGDRNALAELYDRHCAWMMALCYRILQNQKDSEDLIHDVFIEVWNKAAAYNPERGSVKSWLAIRTRSRALDRIRSLNNLRNRQTEELDYNTHSATTSNPSEQGMVHHQARQAIERLSPKQRTVIELSYFQGLTCKEISEQCEIPLGTVKSRLSSAIASLRQHLDPAETSRPCN